MKGAKGGLRDRKITEAYRKKNNSSLKEELKAIENHRKKDGLNLIKDENGIHDIKINEKELENSSEAIIIEDSKEINQQKEENNFEVKEETLEIKTIDNEENKIKDLEIPIEEQKGKNIQEEKEKVAQELPKKHVGTIVEEQELNTTNQDEVVYNQEETTEISEIESTYYEEEQENDLKSAKEEVLEKQIVLEFERMVKEDYYEIKDLEYELKVLSQQEEDAVLQDEVDELKKRIEALLDKFDAIKKKYDTLEFTKDLVNLSIDNHYLTTLVNNYKKEVQDNIVISDLMKKVKETKDYIGIIEKIVYVEKEKESLTTKVEDKKEKFEYRDTNFEELEKQYNDIEKINDEIEAFSNTLDAIIKDIQNKIENMGNISNKRETYTKIVPDMNRLFRAMVQFMVSAMIPRTRVGNVAKAGLVVGAIHNLAHSFKRERTTETRKIVEFTNYEKDILKNMTNIDDFITKLNNASKTIQEIKETFKKEIAEYASFIPEFKELMENIEIIEKELEEKNYYLEKYNHEMKNELEKNNSKVMIYKNV